VAKKSQKQQILFFSEIAGRHYTVGFYKTSFAF